MLTDSKEEPVLKSFNVTKNGEIVFQYLEPQKYLLKVIFDRNINGKWDTGNLEKKVQPEEVIYYQKVLKVRQNWDNNFPWILPETNTFTKKIRDEEQELEKLKNKGKKPKRTSAF